MLDIATELADWCRGGRVFAVATVVGVSGSAPRRPGAALAVDATGRALGSVSGGCVEGALFEECRQALDEGVPRLVDYAADPADPFAPALTCGGAVELLVTPVVTAPQRALLARALAAVTDGEPVALVRSLRGPGTLLLCGWDDTVRGTLGRGREYDLAALARARAMRAEGRTGTVRLGPETLLVETRQPPPRLLVFGAVDFAVALSRVGALLGHRVTVCDPRPVFTTPERFPEADEVIVDRPHRYLDAQRLSDRDAVCVLTHDPEVDVPLLVRALRLPLGYVGAMGSRRTHEDRLRRLRAAGVTEAELATLRSPIGLDLGARTPAETALSIAAEIVALRGGGSGAPLTGGRMPIHRDPAGDAFADRRRPDQGPSPRPERSVRTRTEPVRSAWC
ncbi:XdhC family protein [Streptomyces profundus]|uniref:XdhC family protein n=1 Tax=Streptomyces profundus TaxID=2867410 RepID=UPI001D168CD9|nr:XdhC/CoxI family protein [Streptomyces sp. MA3_2.13]UED87122.1 XdhC family protein [Streptomyces sp. MA3_2.13]